MLGFWGGLFLSLGVIVILDALATFILNIMKEIREK
jgi:hypothetical protein